MDERLNDMLDLFPIEHLLNRDILSFRVEKSRILCIAASYISGTEIIVLDEPSSNLDEENIFNHKRNAYKNLKIRGKLL